MHPGRLVGLAGLAGAALLLSPPAAAQTKPESVATDQESLDENARYAWLDAELKEVEGSTERWYTGWTAAFGWLALGQYAFAASAPNSGLRALSVVGAINSTLGLGAMLIAPNTLSGNAREKLESFDASQPLGAYERRRRAEYLLHATAAEESYYHGPIPLLLAAVVSGAGAFILIRSYDQVLGGIATGCAGVAVTSMQMLTRPSTASNAWKRYVNSTHPVPGSQVPPDQIQMQMSITPMGVALTGTF
jgi:hypothetical protein